MSKQFLFNTEAQNKMKAGVDKLANAVKVTLGPKGRNVAIERPVGAPHITKDGVTVARTIYLTDPVENMGAQMVKEVASKTVEVAGDGTTTATVLAQALVEQGVKNVAAGANPMDLKKGIDKAVTAVVMHLKEFSTPIGSDDNDILNIATVSANDDKEIGGFIAEAMKKVGNDGIITLQDSKDAKSTIEVIEGMQFDRGWMNFNFVNNFDKMRAEYKKPYILVTDKRISTSAPLHPVLTALVNKIKGGEQVSIVIIAPEIDAEAFDTLKLNRMKGGMPIVCVRAPGFGSQQKEILRDIAIFTGATFITDDDSVKLENATLDMMGKCDDISISQFSTLIVGGSGKTDAITARLSSIDNQIENAAGDQEVAELQERKAKLTGGVAVLYVGASTETEMKEKKDRIDDALHATRAAIEEGIVPGGGIAYLRAIRCLNGVTGRNKDEETGINIVKKVLEAPFRQIMVNAGLESADIYSKVINSTDDDYGYNAREENYGNMIQMGVIDPAKVTRVALENAASIASLLLTTDCAIIEVADPMPGTNNTN